MITSDCKKAVVLDSTLSMLMTAVSEKQIVKISFSELPLCLIGTNLTYNFEGRMTVLP